MNDDQGMYKYRYRSTHSYEHRSRWRYDTTGISNDINEIVIIDSTIILHITRELLQQALKSALGELEDDGGANRHIIT